MKMRKHEGKPKMQEYEQNLIKQQTYKTKKKRTIAFEAKYPKGQKLIKTRCKIVF